MVQFATPPRVLAVETGVFQEERQGVIEGDKGLGFAFIQDGNGADTFSKLSRYEATIERGLYKAPTSSNVSKPSGLVNLYRRPW